MLNKLPRGKLYLNGRIIKFILANLSRIDTSNSQYVKEFEKAFALYLSVKHAVAVSSGKLSLYVCLKAVGAKKGDRIIVPAYGAPEVITLIKGYGLKPVFVDIKPETFNIDERLLEEKISKKTRFLLMTHLYGNPCNIDALLTLCKKHGIIIIEDSAQACGAEYRNKKTGTFGDLGYFSFGMYKNLNTLNGSMIVTNNTKLYNRVIKIVNSFQNPKKSILIKNVIKAVIIHIATSKTFFQFFVYPLISLSIRINNRLIYKIMQNKKETKFDQKNFLELFKYGYTNFQAQIGLLQLEYLDLNNKKRIKNALLLSKLLEDTIFKLPGMERKAKPIFLNYIIKTWERDKIKMRLIRKGIDCSEGYLQAFSNEDCKIGNRIEKENLHLPSYPSLEDYDIRSIAEELKRVK